MGRKAIPYNQRARPISFSLKPHLIEKIEQFCEDRHFNRSKFLMEAVNRFMLATDLDHLSQSSNVHDMTIDRRIAVGLAALQEANREGHTVHKGIMDALRNELAMPTTPPNEVVEDLSDSEALGEVTVTRIDHKVNGKSVYEISQVDLRLDDPYDNVLAHIVNRDSRWRIEYHEHDTSFPPFRTLQEAKDAIQAGILG
jgi:hypothetical protein